MLITEIDYKGHEQDGISSFLLRTAVTRSCGKGHACADLTERSGLLEHADRDVLFGQSNGEDDTDDAATHDGDFRGLSRGFILDFVVFHRGPFPYSDLLRTGRNREWNDSTQSTDVADLRLSWCTVQRG